MISRFWSKSYSWKDAREDLIAGATVAAISLPQAMAYALIAGIDPRFGLYSAIVVTFIASIFGSSSHLINGPTNAISLVVFSAIAFLDTGSKFDMYQATFLLGIMIGVIQILIAVFKLGDLTRYISESVVLGFMAGAGFLVALSQVGNLLGIKDKGTGSQHVLLRFWLTMTQGGAVNMRSLGIGLGTVVLVVGLRKVVRKYKLPQMDMLLALIIAAVVAGIYGWSVPGANGKTVISVVGNVPAALPMPHVPTFHLGWVKEMSGSAMAIAFLGLLEALAIAKSISNTTRQKLDYNRQCLAEGLANLVGGFFQCLPGSGSLTRSAINFQAGAISRMSGIFASATVAVCVLLFAPWMRFIPKPALAGILLVTAARLIDWPRLRYAVRASRYDAGLVAITAFAAVFISVEFSILIGVALSVFLFVPRASRLRGCELVVSNQRVVRDKRPDDPPCSSMILFDFEGELFFGAAPEMDRYFAILKQRAVDEDLRVIILRLKRARNPDMVCLERLEHFLHDMDRLGVTVLLCGVGDEFEKGMQNLKFYEWLQPERVFHQGRRNYSSTLKAVEYAYEVLGEISCEHCGRTEQEDRAMYYLA
jgi:SulP family sulfate permease